MSGPSSISAPRSRDIVEDFANSVLIFRLYVWMDLVAQDDYGAVLTEFRHTISERFVDKGYAMAFPQLDLHLAS